jgi:hypothetical protein
MFNDVVLPVKKQAAGYTRDLIRLRKKAPGIYGSRSLSYVLDIYTSSSNGKPPR